MPHEVRAVVAVKKGATVEARTIVVPDPGPEEVLVAVQACGVCHTDPHYREGTITDDFPCLIDQYLYRLLDFPAFVATTLDP